MKARNALIDFLRFVFCLLVVLYHAELLGVMKTGLFSIAYIAVEFFFLVSGYFFAASIEKKRGEPLTIGEWGAFLARKAKPIAPFHLAAFFLMLAIVALFECSALSPNFATLSQAEGAKFAFGEFFARFIDALPNLLLVQCAIFWREAKDLLFPEWYISALFITLFWAYPLCRVLQARVKKLFLPLAIFFASGAVTALVAFFAKNCSWHFMQNFRAAGGLALGMCTFYLSKKIKKRHATIIAFCVLGTLAIATFAQGAVFYALGMLAIFIAVTEASAPATPVTPKEKVEQTSPTLKSNSLLQSDFILKDNCALKDNPDLQGNPYLQDNPALQGSFHLHDNSALQSNSLLQDNSDLQSNSALQGDSSLQGSSYLRANPTLQDDSVLRDNPTLQDNPSFNLRHPTSRIQSLCNTLGKLSLPIYLFHWPILQVIKYLRMG